ncbi:MAG: ABC transporter ATP-binding protein [Terriglobales bacterium]
MHSPPSNTVSGAPPIKPAEMTRLFDFVKPYSLRLILGVMCMAVVGLLEGFRILLVGPILDRVLNPSGQSVAGTVYAPNADNPHDIPLFRIPGSSHTFHLNPLVPSGIHNPWAMVAFAMVAATTLKGIFDYAGTYLVNFVGFRMVTDIRDTLYRSVVRRSVSFFGRHTTGTLVSTLVNDVEKLQVAMSSVLADVMQQVFILVAMTCVVVALGGKLAWVLAGFVPFVIFSSFRIGKRVRKTTRTGQDKLADISNILQETITGNRIVKAFGMEGWETTRFGRAGERLFGANMRSVVAIALTSPIMEEIAAIAFALLLLWGRDLISQHVFTPGTYVAFLFAVFRLYDPIRRVAILFNNNYQQARGASQEIFRFMDATDEVLEKPGAVALPAFRDRIRFENVSFCYTNGDGEDTREILRDINVEVRAGEVVAFVGSSGAGKTTLVNLLPRFFDVTSGRLIFDNTDVRDTTLQSLRSQIGIVTQETILFNDTVRNNIAYGRPDVPLDKVQQAAQAALAHDFITAMPEGYDTVIGERGMRLSGGERQRIAIARAILKNAPVLILDEATSSLDTESEALVQSALQNLMTGRTVFVIAHRLSTVRRADRIVVIESGTIADIGSHEELMGRLGLYRKLHEMQFADLEPVASNGQD